MRTGVAIAAIVCLAVGMALACKEQRYCWYKHVDGQLMGKACYVNSPGAGYVKSSTKCERVADCPGEVG